jgi:CysZ protein
MAVHDLGTLRAAAIPCMRGFICTAVIRFRFHDPSGSEYIVKIGYQYFPQQLPGYRANIFPLIKRRGQFPGTQERYSVHGLKSSECANFAPLNPQSVLKEMIIAIQAYFEAHRFIRRHKLWKWILVPGILYMILFMVGMYFFGRTASTFIEWIARETGLQNWLNALDNSLVSFMFTMFGTMFWLLQMLFYFSLFKYIFLIIGSPLFAYLSEKTEAIMEGKDFPFSFAQLLKDIKRGIFIALRNSLWQTVYLLSILVLTLVPVVGWITPILALLVECYYYGFSMLDYSMERHKKTAAESIFFIGSHKGLAIGNGMIFYLMHGLPFVGWVLAPAYSVIAATLSIYPLKAAGK